MLKQNASIQSQDNMPTLMVYLRHETHLHVKLMQRDHYSHAKTKLWDQLFIQSPTILIYMLTASKGKEKKTTYNSPCTNLRQAKHYAKRPLFPTTFLKLPKLGHVQHASLHDNPCKSIRKQRKPQEKPHHARTHAKIKPQSYCHNGFPLDLED